MQGTTTTQNWLRYWRNSLADAESGKGALKKKDLKSFFNTQVSTFQTGGFEDEANNGRTSVVLKNLFKDESDNTQLVKVLIRPTIYISKYEHGQKHSSTRPDVISPIICPVWVSRHGHFYPAGRPTVPRDLLAPQADDKFTLFDIESLDSFQTGKEVGVFTEQEALALVELENDSDKRYQGWCKYYELARSLFKALNVEEAKSKIDAGYQPEEYKRAYFIKVDDAVNTARNILRLYDWLKVNDSALPLLDNYSLGQVDTHQSCKASSSAISLRLGHSNSKFPLAEAQRDALTHVMTMEDGDILAINGPPGTGKTTFVLSAVASLWIKAALAESEPPIIIAASTNNQAVTNVIAAFGKDFEENDSLFSGRWIPDIKSYGGYFPAASKENDAAALYQTKAFYESLEQSEFIDRAEAAFLTKARVTFEDEGLQSIKSVKAALLKEMVSCHSRLTHVETAWRNLNQAKKHCIEAMGNDPLHTFKQSQQALAYQEDELEHVVRDQKSWQSFCASESIWLLLFSWLPPVARKLLLMRRVFVENTFSNIAKTLIRNELDVDEVLTRWLGARRKKISELKQRHESFRLLIDRLKQAQNKWVQVTTNVYQRFSKITQSKVPNQKVPSVDQVDEALDITLRFRLFQLAVHYWEARWLMECRKLETNGNSDWAGHTKTGLRSVLPRWRRRMMLTPCIVSTLHSLPSHMTHQAFKDEAFRDEYLINEIDLLIIDEAGQVSPDVAAASFSLAKKALVIGDIHQIEPVRSLTRSVDIGNLLQYGVMADKTQYSEISKAGATVIEGSVMRIAQRTSRYHYLQEVEPGMFLREHRRCYDEIISFSNDLCYQGLLIPKRGVAASDNLFPPMAYLHVDGRAESPPAGSRYNALEATQVAAWLAGNREKIEAYYQTLSDDYTDKCLEDLVGVVTPFKAQQELIESACTEQGIKVGRGEAKLTVGTVHALQGAERPLIIFSAVYSRHSDGNFIDMNASMLNVAVSRAKDSFIVFGDMDVISAASRGKPRHLLSRYLFSSDDNELVFPLEKRPDLLRACGSPKLINNAEQHDEYIRQVLQKAENQVDMVSPWISVSRLQETGLYEEMVAASQRGVDVNLYTDYHFNSTTMNQYDESKAAKFQRSVEQLNSAGINVFVVNGVHSKLVMADKRFMSVGSFNWCSAARSGKYTNMETSMIYSGDLGEEISLQVKALKSRLKRGCQTEAPANANLV